MGNGAKKNNHFTIWGIKGDTAKTFNSPNLSLSDIITNTKFRQRDRPFLIPVSKYYGSRNSINFAHKQYISNKINHYSS